MRSFSCARCAQLVFFDNSACLHCGALLGFDWPTRELITALPDPGGPELVAYTGVGDGGTDGGAPSHRCANVGVARCNWLVERAGDLCRSCSLTRTRPADADAEGLDEFAAAEAAKRRLLFELGEHELPVASFREQEEGLAFELLSSEHAPVTTGHADGVITLDLAESDPVHRETMREQLGEPYRTVLGHFRHEIGHYYWPLLVEEDPELLERYRTLFGDEREDYGEALDRHYENGPPADWHQRFVSAYATMHPWEDWAETWAHYLHISDTMQTAEEYGMRVEGPEAVPDPNGELSADPAGAATFRDVLRDWLPLTYALNAINRSMGREDLYPFVVTAEVAEKLKFVDAAVRAHAARRVGA